MKIAVIGCSHGELDQIYEDIARIETKDNIVIDLVIICGDFQAVRNEHDLQCMAVPVKYRHLQTFHKYYSSETTAPKLTLFIGGNHEASNYLQTLAYGGWVADNIYYMGYASVVRFRGLRIGGISGIHDKWDRDSSCGHFERLPFDETTKRSSYHMRRSDVYKLMQLSAESAESQALDVMISHDWPINIHLNGNVDYLLKRKKYFYDDISKGRLGNPLLEPLVPHLKPRHWFAAHLHVRFEALVNYTDDQRIQTRFLALDKVLPNRQYMDIIDIEPTVPSDSDCLEYDAEWLAVLKSTNHLLSIEKKSIIPSMSRHSVNEKDINRVKELFNSDLKIPNNFRMTEPALFGRINDRDPQRVNNYANPQTIEFCKRLAITDPMSAIIETLKPIPNPEQISLSDDEEDEDSEQLDEKPQKRRKEDDAVDGGNLFFVDRKGAEESKGDKTCDTFAKETNDSMVDSIPTIPSIASTSTPNESLTKRQIKRRADKLKRKQELRQLEKWDKIQGVFPKIDLKSKKQENKMNSELRRKMIIERLVWNKSNLPMKSPDSEVNVISLHQLSMSS